MTSSNPAVLETLSDGVLTLELNRPEKYNVLSSEAMGAIRTSIAKAAGNTAIRVVVIEAGGKAFCAGHDLNEMGDACDLDGFRALFATCSALMMDIQKLPQPVIARVHGVATAAGCQLVAMCDLAVAADTAKFAVSGINLGLFCSTPAVALSRNVPRKAALEMLLTGEFIDAHTAVRYGLINRAVPEAVLDAEIDRLTQSICAKSVDAISIGKSLFYKQIEVGIEQAYEMAAEAMAQNAVRPDSRAGIARFTRKK